LGALQLLPKVRPCKVQVGTCSNPNCGNMLLQCKLSALCGMVQHS
jgi:hypothetical protein